MHSQNPGTLERLKNFLVRNPATVGFASSATDADAGIETGTVAGWAKLQGLQHQARNDGQDFVLTGTTGEKPWKLECGVPTRDFIHGQELLARANLDIPEDIGILIVNRRLREALELKTYNLYTESLQTVLDQSLPVEMRWLAMYDEIGWKGLPSAFWKRYAVVADEREHASAWITPELAALMMSWPEPAPDADVPFIMLLRRGKAYLRMQYSPADLPTLEHAAVIFTTACDAAVAALSTDIVI